VNPGYVDLLVSILNGIPKLEDAACSGRADQWTLLSSNDPQRGPQAARAIAACKRCPALQLCTHQLDGLDNPPVDMVQAGRIITKGGQPRKASSTPGKSLRLELAPLSPVICKSSRRCHVTTTWLLSSPKGAIKN
jgi:hypothetical protein